MSAPDDQGPPQPVEQKRRISFIEIIMVIATVVGVVAAVRAAESAERSADIADRAIQVSQEQQRASQEFELQTQRLQEDLEARQRGSEIMQRIIASDVQMYDGKWLFTVRNINQVPIDIFFLVKDFRGSRRNMGIRVAPCSTSVVTAVAPGDKFPSALYILARKGQTYWTTGLDAYPVVMDELFRKFGNKRKDGQTVINFQGQWTSSTTPDAACDT